MTGRANVIRRIWLDQGNSSRLGSLAAFAEICLLPAKCVSDCQWIETAPRVVL